MSIFSLNTNDDNLRDFRVGANGRLELNTLDDTVIDRLRTRLATWARDWYLNTDRGIDYPGKFLGTFRNGSEMSAIIRREILEEPGVNRINSLRLDSPVGNPRQVVISANVTLEESQNAIDLEISNV